MLKKEDLLKKMLEHFPRWTDIRKRATKSTGGKVAEAIAEETALIQEAIEDYKKDFFIESYIGKEDSILSLAYRIYIGSVEISELKITEPEKTATKRLDLFLESDKYAYYEDGWIYIKDEVDFITYMINDFKYKEQTETFHVWNIYDEFAAFVGLTREMFETNQELENRILNVFKDKQNSSGSGLKQAILTELINIDPSLRAEDIIIEGVTPSNLQKQYNEFTTILDKLASINKDVYRLKQWDVDTWAYPLKTIAYISHFWDIALETYKNGIGKENDLAVSISKPTDKTDAIVRFYVKSEEKLKSYLLKQELLKTFRLNLSAHDDVVNPFESKYRVKASSLVDITDSDIAFQVSDVKLDNSKMYANNFIKSSNEELSKNGIQTIDTRVLNGPKRYVISLTPVNALGDYCIKKLNFVNGNKTTSLLREDENWGYRYGELRYKGYTFFGNQTKHFDSVEGAVDINERATLAQNQNKMILKAHLTDIQNKRFYCNIDSELVNILSDYVQAINFDYNSTTNTYTSPVPSNQSQFIIDGKFNGLKMYVKGKVWVRVVIDNGEPFEYAISDNYVSVPTYYNPRKIHMEIISTSSTEVVEISNIQYTFFETKISLSNGEFVVVEGSEYFPNYEENDITIEVTAYSAGSPYIDYIIAGKLALASNVFITESFEASAEGCYIDMDISNNFFAELIPVDESNNFLKDDPDYIDHYNPVRYFQLAEGIEKARIEIDLSNYVSITSLEPNAGTIKNYYGTYYVELLRGDVLETIFISGQRISEESRALLIDIFNVDVEQGEKLYISNIFDGFAIKKADKQEFIKLSDLDYYKTAFKSGLFEFTNLPDNINAAFEKGYTNTTDIDMGSSRYYGRINNAYLHSKGNITSIAYNKNFIFQEVKSDVEIIDTFKPFLEQNGSYMYCIENMTPEVRVKFLNGCDNDTYNVYAITRTTPIELSCDLNLMSPESYAINKIDLDINVRLAKTVALQDTYELETGDTIQLQQYQIKVPSGLEVNYNRINPEVDSIEKYPDMYGYEIIYMKDEMYNKLNYCNVDEVLYIGTVAPADGLESNIPSTAYEVLKDEGIIVWNSSYHINAYSEIYVKYTVRKPVSITIHDDLLYEVIETDLSGNKVDAYDLIKTKDDITEVGNGDFLDLSDDIYFNEADRIVVDCSLPSFNGYKESKGIRFVQEVEDNVISLKSGYYYFDGLEYYLFANETTDEVGQTGNTKFFNTIKENNMLILRKSSNNYVKNSILNLKGLGNVFNQNFEHEHSIEGASSIKAITACNSFNHWQTVGMNLGFDTGLNDIGIKLMPVISDGYAMLDLTDSLYSINKLSMYANGDIEAYIGYCPKDKEAINMINIKEALSPTISEKELLEITFENEGYSYFLIVKGSGIIDDIILMDADAVSPKWKYHKKNIDTLGFKIEERRPDGYTQRLLLTNPDASYGEGAELVNDGYIINSPHVEWNQTKAKEFSTDEDWSDCEFTNLRLTNGFIEANVIDGELMTPAIYIGDKRMIQNIIIKINDVDFEQMTGIRTSLLTGSDSEGNFTKLPSSMDNVLVVSSQNLMEYIKLKVEIPKGKVISSIKLYIEYISTDEAAPVESIMYNGKFISQILDTYMSAKYQLTDFAVEEISDMSHADFFIRGAKETSENKVWTDWKHIVLEDGKLTNKLVFDNYRYFQVLVSLKHKNAYVKLGHIDMKVVR